MSTDKNIVQTKFRATGYHLRGQKPIRNGRRLIDNTDIDETKFVVFEHRFTIDHYFMTMFIYYNKDIYSFHFLFFFSRLTTAKSLNEEGSNLGRLT